MKAPIFSIKTASPYQIRLEFFAIIILVCSTASILFNNILSYIDPNSNEWTSPTWIPVLKPIGSDFRVGLYKPAEALIQGENPYLDAQLIYPPFTVYVGMIFNLLPEWRAYLVQVGLIFLLNLASIYLLARLGVNIFIGDKQDTGFGIFLSALTTIAIYLFSSYGFFFNIERGNFDTYPLFLSVLFLWLLWKYPKRIWLQVFVISTAAHLKVYPIIFYALVIWKHGWKSILPLIIINLVLLFCLGPGNARIFLETISFHANRRPSTWIGNHSAYSYASFWDWQPGKTSPTLTELVFLIAPIVVWIITAIILYKRGFNIRRAVWLYAVSVPLGNIIPRVSYDYKLLWVYTPAILLLIYLMKIFVFDRKKAALGVWLVLALVLTLCSRSFEVTPDILANKYPYIFFLQFLIAVTAVLDHPNSSSANPDLAQLPKIEI
jgi:predicted membrane protein